MTIKQIIFVVRYRLAVRKADALHRQYKRKYMIILLQGRPVVASKRQLSEMIHAHRFKKGVKVTDIEKRALYVTL